MSRYRFKNGDRLVIKRINRGNRYTELSVIDDSGYEKNLWYTFEYYKIYEKKIPHKDDDGELEFIETNFKKVYYEVTMKYKGLCKNSLVFTNNDGTKERKFKPSKIRNCRLTSL